MIIKNKLIQKDLDVSMNALIENSNGITAKYLHNPNNCPLWAFSFSRDVLMNSTVTGLILTTPNLCVILSLSLNPILIDLMLSRKVILHWTTRACTDHWCCIALPCSPPPLAPRPLYNLRNPGILIRPWPWFMSSAMLFPLALIYEFSNTVSIDLSWNSCMAEAGSVLSIPGVSILSKEEKKRCLVIPSAPGTLLAWMNLEIDGWLKPGILQAYKQLSEVRPFDTPGAPVPLWVAHHPELTCKC